MMDTKEKMPGCPVRLGMFGGTFSPPHRGHIAAALAFRDALSLDLVTVIPAGQPPHKTADPGANAADRLAMTRLAFAGVSGVEVSDMEIRREGRSYTSDTLAALAAPGRELFLLCGSDMFLTLGTWHEPQRIFSLATVAWVRRENEPETLEKLLKQEEIYRQNFDARTVPVPLPVREVSSSQVRDAVRAGADISSWVTPQVASYIRERRLYL